MRWVVQKCRGTTLKQHLHPVTTVFLGKDKDCWGKMSREQQILSLLRQSQQGFTPKQIAETLRIPHNTVKVVLRRLYWKGEVSVTSKGKYLYRVTNKNYRVTNDSDDNYKESYKSNIESYKKVTRVTEEKVTKGNIERDKSDIERDKGYITLPVSDARKRTTLDLKNRTIVILNWKKTSLGRSMSDLVDEAVQKQWGKPHSI